MPTHGDVVEDSTDEDEDVPDGVREGNDSVTFEEDETNDVDGATDGKLTEPRRLLLQYNNV